MKISESFKNKEVIRGTTRAGLLIYLFSELNEEGKIIKCADFQYISNIIGRTSYYEGIRKLKEKRNYTRR